MAPRSSLLVVAVALSCACGPTLGSVCTQDVDCGLNGELVCARTVRINGTQQGQCFRPCSTDTECASDEQCVSWRTVGGKPVSVCLVLCANDDDDC